MSSCLPTPAEVKALVDAGYRDRLAFYQKDPTSDAVGVIAPKLVGAGVGVQRKRVGAPCTFYLNGKCELHELGLKPLEGRLAHHLRKTDSVTMAVAMYWKPGDYAELKNELRTV
jgi:hypothetical protein